MLFILRGRRKGDSEVTAIIITAIICVTLVALSLTGDASKDKLLMEQAALLGRYKALVDMFLAAVPDGELGEQEVPPPEIDGGE